MMNLSSDKQKSDKVTVYICFCGPINVENTQKFMTLLATKLPSETRKLYILFTTNGGSVSSGFALYHFLRALPFEIIMHNIGSVDSIGNIVFLAADKRYATENGTFLIHGVEASIKNSHATNDYLQEKMSTMQSEEKKIKNILKNRTRLTDSDLDRLFQAGAMEDARFALKKEMIDAICDPEIPAPTKPLIVDTNDNKD